MIELGGLGGDNRGMVIGQIDDRSPERQIAGARDEMREEHQRRGNRLGARREMLAHPQFIEPERIREQRLFNILLKRRPQRTVGRMQRHHPHSKAHARTPSAFWRMTCPHATLPR
jgi:hypothetical protein